MSRETFDVASVVFGALGFFVGFLVGRKHGLALAGVRLLPWLEHEPGCRKGFDSKECPCGLLGMLGKS